jgi:hypothetical protein
LGAIQATNFPLYYSPNGNYVEMGGFTDMIRNHKKSDRIVINYIINNGKNEIFIETIWIANSESNMPTLLSLKMRTTNYSLSIEKQAKYNVELCNISKIPVDKFKIPEEEDEKRLMELFSQILHEIQKEKKIIENIELLNPENPIYKFQKSNISAIINEIHEKSIGNILITEIYNDLKNMFSNLEKGMNYISSFRKNPERTYYQKTGSLL